MNGLHKAFDEIVADVPVYGDLDRAIEQADRNRHRRYAVVAGLAAAAAVVAVIAGMLAVAQDTDTAPPISPHPTPTPTQSPETWADTPVAATAGYGWEVPDPLKAARHGWLTVVADHLDTAEPHLRGFESSAFGLEFERPAVGSIYSTGGRIGLSVDGADLNPFDGCRYLTGGPEASNGTESCSEGRFAGQDGERASVSRWGRHCGAYEGGGPGLATCGDYRVAVAVERRDGLIGYVLVEGRGTPDFNPFSTVAMAAAAADPRLTLPESAYTVPSDKAVVRVVEDQFPGYRVDDEVSSVDEHMGKAQAWGRLGRLGLRVEVWPAGGTPECGRSWLIECVERRVYGADDPTTVFVGAWDEEDWADCCPKNSRADSRVFVYVGPRHTVVVSEYLIVRAEEEPISADLDQRLIDLALDPRLQ
jgi:hypothetical protein